MRHAIPLVLALTAAASLTIMNARTHAAIGQDPELGLVRWTRDFDAALNQSKHSGKPLLVLFDEIPGCATCRGFGAQVLSYPLLVDAIESEFVPLAIHNNVGGADAAVLARYGEPAWNNPVIRFLDARGNDLIPRRDGLYSEHEIAQRLVAALEAAKRPVPEYLSLAFEESHLATRETATFAMSCYWEGEARLGALDGVVSTRAVSKGGQEAVEVVFDDQALPYGALLEHAASAQCATTVFARDENQLAAARKQVGARAVRDDRPAHDASSDDQKYYLNHSPLRFVPLTPMQATRVNAALHEHGDALRWLSPRQRELATAIDQALRHDAGALAGLMRPDDIDALASYEVTLRSRLAPRAHG